MLRVFNIHINPMMTAASKNPPITPVHEKSEFSLNTGEVMIPNKGKSRRIATTSSVKKYSNRCLEVR
jgi:hypothetical protein